MENLNISVEQDGDMVNMVEVIAILKGVLDNYSTHAMSDREIYLRGKKDMLAEVIEYLGKTL